MRTTKTRRAFAALPVAIALMIGLSACDKSPDDPSPSPSTTESADPTQDDDALPTGPSEWSIDDAVSNGAITTTTTINEGEYAVAVGPLMTWNGKAALPIVLESTAIDATVGYSMMDRAYGNDGIPIGTTLFNTADNVVYPAAMKDDYYGYGAPFTDFEAAGQAQTAWTIHTAPSTTDLIDVFVENIGFLYDIPVVKAAEMPIAPVWDSEDPSTDPTAIPTLVAPRESVSSAVDGTRTTTIAGDEMTISLPGDVFFAKDSAEISPESGEAIDQVANEIKTRTTGGTITVTGHTDDVGTPEHNQELSEQRAQAVADRLGQTLTSGYDFAVEGKGSTEPAVEGTSEAARAANRRVEVLFTVTTTPTLTVETGSLPEVSVPVATGTAGIDIPAPAADNGDIFHVSLPQVTRRDGVILADFTVTNAATTADGTIVGYFDMFKADLTMEDEASLPYYPSATQSSFASGVTILTADSRYWPLAYTTVDTNTTYNTILGHAIGDLNAISHTSTQFPVDHVMVTLPDTGQSTITIDVPGKFRLTDVPVVDAK